MCQKKDYTRRAVTILLAVLTALFVLAYMTNSRAFAFNAPDRFDRSFVVRKSGA